MTSAIVAWSGNDFTASIARSFAVAAMTQFYHRRPSATLWLLWELMRHESNHECC
jgi:hypothetical protein